MQQLSFGYGYDKFIKVYAAIQDNGTLIQNSHYNTWWWCRVFTEKLQRSILNTTFSYTLGTIKSTNTCTEQQTVSSLCKVSEKIMCDFTGKTNLSYNHVEKCNGLEIEGNFHFAISYFCNIWFFWNPNTHFLTRFVLIWIHIHYRKTSVKFHKFVTVALATKFKQICWFLSWPFLSETVLKSSFSILFNILLLWK